ncbi:sulfatase-like hydrolase/transferase [Sorangium sp. So ce1128]
MAVSNTAYCPISTETLTFDGRTSRAIPNSTQVNFPRAQDFTVAFHVRPAPVQPSQPNPDHSMVEKWEGVGGYPFVVRYLGTGADKGKLFGARYDGAANPGVKSTTLINDGKFHHIAFVRRTQSGRSVLELYVDGKLEASSPDTTTGNTQNNAALYLGCRGLNGKAGVCYFAGQLSNLKIYSAALTPAEIAALATTRPNILLIVADDLGVDVLRINDATGEVTAQIDGPDGTVGPKRLPNLEKLIQHGMHFSRAWAQPVCSATRGSLFTGMQPWRTNVGYPDPGGNNALVMNPKSGAAVRTLAEVLNGAGYRSGMFGKWHMGTPATPRPLAKPAGGQKNDPKRTPWDWGWERFEGILEGGFRVVAPKYGYKQATFNLAKLTPAKPAGTASTAQTDAQEAAYAAKREAVRIRTTEYLRKVTPDYVESQPDIQFYAWEKCYEDDPTGVMLYDRPPTERTHMYATRDQVYAAKDWIGQVLGSPWCVALTLTTPHDPYHVPPKESYTLQFANPSAPTTHEMFVAMIESMDFYIGKLLSSPEPEIQDQLRNTVIFFIGDNGTQDEDPDRPGVSLDTDEEDKATPHIGSVHVPMIVADGGSLLAGNPCYLTSTGGSPAVHGASADLVHILDIFRTCADIAGTTAPEAVDSVSLKPYLQSGSVKKRDFNFSQQFGFHKMLGGRTTNKFALVSDGKYLLSCDRSKFNANNETDEYTFHLYELLPHATIVGALQEKEITNFLSDPTSRAVAQRLYDEMKKNYLDGGGDKDALGDANPARGPLPFPTLAAPPSAELDAVDPNTFPLKDVPLLIENAETKRYLFSDGPPIKGERGAEGGWLAASGFESPNVVGADANYYNRAVWIIRQQGNDFLIENAETKRYLFSDGLPIQGGRGAEGGWTAASGFESPKVVGADANYYNRALWVIRRSGDKFIIENKETKRYLFSDGPPIKGERGAEGGWLAASGFKSPNVVGADANYYNRALWSITKA